MSGTYPLAGVSGDVWATANPSIGTTNESCTDSGDHTNYTASVHAFWDIGTPVVVQNSPDGSTGWTTVTDYVFYYPIGKITFNTARTPGTNAFTRIASGNYFTATQADYTSKWSLSLKGNVQKTTVFQATGAWEQNTGATKSGSGQFDTYRTDNRYFKEFGNLLVLQLYVDKTNNVRWQGYVRVTEVDPSADQSKIQMQTVKFLLERDAFFLTS